MDPITFTVVTAGLTVGAVTAIPVIVAATAISTVVSIPFLIGCMFI